MKPHDKFNIVGTVVDGRYRIERVVGEGGFGVVYRARHLRLDGPVAIKVLKLPHELDAREAMTTAFENEGKLLFSLATLHASIVRVTESGALLCPEGTLTPYLVLEWLNGVTLDRELDHRVASGLRPMGLSEMVELLDGPAEALATAHRRWIAHRDIKPGNLFLSSQSGRVVPKLLDFGTAKVIEASVSAAAMFANTAGARCSFTPAYGAPEQWDRSVGATGPWTDVHALALVCLEILTQRAVFEGDSAQLMAACLDEGARPTPRNRGLDVPDQVEAAFVRALSVDPRKRFPDAGEFWQVLRGGLDSKPRTLPSIALLSGPQSVSVRKAADDFVPMGTTLPPSTQAPLSTTDRLDVDKPMSSGATLESPVVSRARSTQRTTFPRQAFKGSVIGALLIAASVVVVSRWGPTQQGATPVPEAVTYGSAATLMGGTPFTAPTPSVDSVPLTPVDAGDGGVRDSTPQPSRSVVPPSAQGSNRAPPTGSAVPPSSGDRVGHDGLPDERK